MNPFAANLSAIRNIMSLKSRAPRSEYWWVVATFVAGIVLAWTVKANVFPHGGGASPLYNWLKFGYILFFLTWGVALCSLSVRRLHDADRSGLWVWLYLLALPLGVILVPILCLKRGTNGTNRFGPDPKIHH